MTSLICGWSHAAVCGEASPATGAESAHAAATAKTTRRPTCLASSAAPESFRLDHVNLEITPEPTPEERAAIVAALERLGAGEECGPGAWWEAGLRESVEDEDAE